MEKKLVSQHGHACQDSRCPRVRTPTNGHPTALHRVGLLCRVPCPFASRGLFARGGGSKMKLGGGGSLPAGATKQKKTLAEKLREDSWRLHYGANLKRAMCHFCGVTELSFNDKMGWQAAHVVPEKFATHHHHVYNLVPCCAACNRSMGTDNALDYLWNANRTAALKTVCTNIYAAVAGRADDATHMNVMYDGCIWKLIQKLFGSDEHTAGGGITCVNEQEIYGALILHQASMLRDQMADHMRAAAELATQAEKLTRNPFVPSKRARLFA